MNVCPECRQGKHVNCTDEAFDEVLDAVVTCDCATDGHLS